MTTQVLLACMTTTGLVAGLYCTTVTVAWLAFAIRDAGVTSRLTEFADRVLTSWACRHCPCAGPNRS